MGDALPPAGESGPGFRPAGEFGPPLAGSTGSVIGNFIDVPFDTALRLILQTHQLEFVVYGGQAGQEGARYGRSDQKNGESYEKPVIMVTSKERLEQELKGQNRIDLYQFHYADPGQVTDLLGQFDLLPGTNTGWYIYQGSGGNSGQGGGQGGGNNGGRYGGGGGGGRGGGGNGPGGGMSGLLVYRGDSREPAEQAVQSALASGRSMVRVLLTPENDPNLLTTAVTW